MHISEIPSDSKLTIEIRKGDRSATFFSSPKFIIGGDVYIEPLMHSGKMLSFDSPGLHIAVTASWQNSAPTKFLNIRITRELVDGKLYHCISSKTAGVRNNRRASFRIFVGESGKAFSGSKPSGEDVTIRDISESGISFLADDMDNAIFRTGEKVHVRYDDPENSYRVDVESRVVRTEDNDKGKIYGCAFIKNYPQISKYVMSKQAHNKRRKKK